MRTIAALLALFCLQANAELVTATWVNATKNTDGSNYTNKLATRMHYALCPNVSRTSPSVSVGPTVQTASVDLAPGAWCLMAIHVNSAGVESAPSNVATKTIVAPPAPPTGLTVQASNMTAYTIGQSSNRVALIPIGTVPAGTACDGAQKILDGYVVPRAALIPAGTVNPQVVIAKCAGS